MNIGTIDLLVSNHIDDIRRRGRLGQNPAARTGSFDGTAAGRRGRLGQNPAARTASCDGTAARRPHLRSRIGFALVEAGLHLQATAGRYHADHRVASE